MRKLIKQETDCRIIDILEKKENQKQDIYDAKEMCFIEYQEVLRKEIEDKKSKLKKQQIVHEVSKRSRQKTVKLLKIYF